MKSGVKGLPQIIIHDKLIIDNRKISEEDAAKLWGILVRAYLGGRNTDSELIKLVLGITRRQNPQVSEEELLQSFFDIEHISASLDLLTTVIKYTAQSYNLHHWINVYKSKYGRRGIIQEDYLALMNQTEV